MYYFCFIHPSGCFFSHPTTILNQSPYIQVVQIKVWHYDTSSITFFWVIILSDSNLTTFNTKRFFFIIILWNYHLIQEIPSRKIFRELISLEDILWGSCSISEVKKNILLLHMLLTYLVTVNTIIARHYALIMWCSNLSVSISQVENVFYHQTTMNTPLPLQMFVQVHIIYTSL